MTIEQYATIVEYAQTLNSNIPSGSDDTELLEFIVNDVVDRVLIYLNMDILSDNLLRIVARLVVTAYNKADATYEATEQAQGVSEVSDNGQTVKFTAVKAYFASTGDDELMDGFSTLLKSYRRVGVVGESRI